MTEVAKKQGMSKGCLIGLIVVGVLLILIIAISITCYLKREDLAKFGAATVVNGLKEMVAKEPPQGIDTTKFDAVSDGFLKKLKESKLDGEKYKNFMTEIQSIASDKKVDSAEAVQFMNAIYDYFPELKESIPEGQMPESDSTAAADTLQSGE
jgi:hypothetical protein